MVNLKPYKGNNKMKLTNKILNRQLTKKEKLDVMYTHNLVDILQEFTNYHDHLKILNLLLWEGFTPQDVIDSDNEIIDSMIYEEQENERVDEIEYELILGDKGN